MSAGRGTDLASITEQQALSQAEELRKEFQHNALMRARDAQISRETQPDIEALGITDANVQQVVPWVSDAANQEGHLYATALSLAEAQVEVYVESEQPTKQGTGEKLEGFYQGIADGIIGDQYDTCRDIATKGVGIDRIDEVGRFFHDVPDLMDDEEAEEYLKRVEEHRKAVGLPFQIVGVDPRSCYYVEDQRRREVEFACEFRPMRESRVKKGGDPTLKGEMIIVRTKEHIWHFWVPSRGGGDNVSGGKAMDVIWEGENRFGHTGYILYRGRYTGFEDIQRRYDPYVMATLNVSEALSLWITLQGELLVQTLNHWTEEETEKGAPQDREASVARKLRGGGGAVRASGGTVAAEFAPGVRVRYRDMTGDIAAVLNWLMQEYDLYRFRDVLMGEASGDASGRAIIRLQEAAGRQLSPGLRAREQGLEETIRVIRRTLFTRPEYLAGKTDRVYIARMLSGDAAGDVERKKDLIELSKDEDIPHDIKVSCAAESRAAQLALLEEGKMLWEMPDPMLDRDSIWQDFLRLKNIPKVRQRLAKDEGRKLVIPVAIQNGAAQALKELGKTPPKPKGVVMNGNGGPGGGSPGTSGAPDNVMPEDAAAALQGGVPQ